MDEFWDLLKDSRSLQIFATVVPVLTGAAGWFFAKWRDRKQHNLERMEDKTSRFKAERKKDDFEHYKILISMYQNFLVMTLPYADLNIHPGQRDLDLDRDSVRYARRRTLYEYLFYMFERAFMLREAMRDEERLGSSVENRWEGWEIWIKSYLARKSVQDEFDSVGDYGLNEKFQKWVKRRIAELNKEDSVARTKTWATVAPEL